MRVRRLRPHGGATHLLEQVRLQGSMEAVAEEVAGEGEEAESVSCADRRATGRAVWYHFMRSKLYIPDVSALACPNGGSKRQKSFGESRGGGGGGGGWGREGGRGRGAGDCGYGVLGRRLEELGYDGGADVAAGLLGSLVIIFFLFRG